MKKTTDGERRTTLSMVERIEASLAVLLPAASDSDPPPRSEDDDSSPLGVGVRVGGGGSATVAASPRSSG